MLINPGIDWSSVPWSTVIPRLLLYAHRRLRNKPFSGADVSAEDIVLGAIEKTMTGARQWNASAIGLQEHLMGVILSDIYNAVRKRSQTVEINEAILGALHSEMPSPEEIVLQRDELTSITRYLRDNHPDLAEFVSLMMLSETTRPQELSVLLNKPARDIYRLKERLRSVLEDFRRSPAQRKPT